MFRELIEKENRFSRPRLSTATFTPPENNNNAILLNGNLERKPSGAVPPKLNGTLERKPSGSVPPKLNEPLERKPSGLLPSKEVPQEEINRAFTNELLKAKQKLRSSGRISVEEEVQVDGVPLPPPPSSFILPGSKKVPGSTSIPPPPPPAPFLLKKSSRVLPAPTLDPRDDLLAAIRRAGGVSGLKKTRT